ncbi:MAG: 30S ribosomal protein S16 [Victivallales bacterium]|nr:30S ribosomal protein S16 [Victivallales bacterium]
MAVKIRLKRTGSKNNACFRMVVTDVRAQRDGKAIEFIGFYDPRHKDESVDMERVKYWVSQGAVMSDTCAAIVKRVESGKKLSEIVRKPSLSKKAKAKEEAAKKAAEEAKAAEAAPAEA